MGSAPRAGPRPVLSVGGNQAVSSRADWLLAFAAW